ncbi:MAG: phosphoenolpyruvate carboxykinase (ATP) [Nitrospirae bacterium]|uniref:phosphoenolpyruvate carboxykinase (ATP) n=1 Tax=Candidatus Magnetobacterium casense TaxID=1455061 RepID=UPI00058F88F7|nr:phosphoenolpyruvate carboxykinase (ATP) [Candidatus Magnetobacterium casensis]MBF0337514.1 phosphoenolpyruvate carboxykinase (ATP) [Nitrospirota bacterium]
MSSKTQLPGSPWRAIIESAMYANSVHKTTMRELYEYAVRQPEVIVTSEPMYKPQTYGLPADAKVLVSNDGTIVGRTARARRLVRQMGSDRDMYLTILREAVYQFNKKPAFWMEGIVGLHSDFMVKAHLVSPTTDAKNMLDWTLNFTPWMKPWTDTYATSRPLDEPDIIVLADSDWSHPGFPDGLIIVDEKQNCIAILGLRYFGERKKGTLTLAWSVGVRQNMVACHGGIKKIGKNPPIAVFGLSGSGKSSITNSDKHESALAEGEQVTVVHDDAFLIDLDNDLSIAIEPNLFDKTDAVVPDDPIIKYFYSAQNVGITLSDDGKRKLVCADVRNRNGRCIKTRDMFKHRDYCERPGKVIWLQKDTSLPPISKIDNLWLAVAMGASLSTLRAKGVENVDPKEFEKLVIEPFANPFRVHPLLWDCQQFYKLFEGGTECYIMNTNAFGLPESLIDIPKELSLSIVTELVRNTIVWKEWNAFQGLLIPQNGNELFGADFDQKYEPSQDESRLRFLRDRMQDRINFLSNKRDVENDMDSAIIDPIVAARTVLDKLLTPLSKKVAK